MNFSSALSGSFGSLLVTSALRYGLEAAGKKNELSLLSSTEWVYAHSTYNYIGPVGRKAVRQFLAVFRGRNPLDPEACRRSSPTAEKRARRFREEFVLPAARAAGILVESIPLLGVCDFDTKVPLGTEGGGNFTNPTDEEFRVYPDEQAESRKFFSSSGEEIIFYPHSHRESCRVFARQDFEDVPQRDGTTKRAPVVELLYVPDPADRDRIAGPIRTRLFRREIRLMLKGRIALEPTKPEGWIPAWTEEAVEDREAFLAMAPPRIAEVLRAEQAILGTGAWGPQRPSGIIIYAHHGSRSIGGNTLYQLVPGLREAVEALGHDTWEKPTSWTVGPDGHRGVWAYRPWDSYGRRPGDDVVLVLEDGVTGIRYTHRIVRADLQVGAVRRWCGQSPTWERVKV